MKFTNEQNIFIKRGGERHARLIRVAERAVKTKDGKATYIYSPPGLGKTHSMNAALSKAKVTYYNVNGNMAMFGFGVELAIINYLDRKSKRIIVNVNDCDELFKNEATINIVKNMIDDEKVYRYTKSMSTHIANLDTFAQDAVKFHQDPQRVGFTVPLDRFIFVITSNFQLPNDDEVLYANKTHRASAPIMAHKNAIRSRCHTNDFKMDLRTQWGWVVNVVLDPKFIPKISKTKKVEILKWMYDNLDNLTERSIRTAQKMAEIMIENPKTYKIDWTIDFIKS